MCKGRKEAWRNEKCKDIEEMERKHRTKEMHAKVKEMATKNRSPDDDDVEYAPSISAFSGQQHR